MDIKVARYLVNVGRATQKLREALDHDIFDDLSKHSTYWQSEDEKTDGKLHDIRMALSIIREALSEALYKIEGDYED